MLSIEILSAFAFSIVFIYLIIKYAVQLRLIDIPNGRSSHKKPIPKGAGIGFVLAALVTAFICNSDLMLQNLLTVAAIAIVLGVGVLDDILDLSPKMKLLAILIAVVMIYFDGFAITTLGNYLGHEAVLPWLFVLPFTYLSVVGFSNALNLIDGIDGLAGGVSMVILITLFAIGVKFGDAFIVLISASFALALAAFMFFNWSPAKIFMGDSGSLTLGFVIATLFIKSLEYINPTVVLFITAIPLLDTLSVIRRRLQRRQSIFKADKNHLHHILLKQKRDVRFTAQMLIMMQFVFSAIGFRLIGQDDSWNVVLFAALFIIYFNLFDPRGRKRKKVKQKEPHHLQVAMREEEFESSTSVQKSN